MDWADLFPNRYNSLYPNALYAAAWRAMGHLAAALGEPADAFTRTADETTLAQAARRLAKSGYRLRAKPDFARMAELRADYQGCVDAIAEHLGKPSAILMRPR